MNRPEKQFFSQIAKRRNAIYDEDDGYQADVDSAVAGAEGRQKLSLERRTYIAEKKNDSKCTSEHDISDEEPLKALDVPNVKKATGNDLMEIRDLKFSGSIVGDSIPFFSRPRTAPAHPTPLVSIRGGKQSRNPLKEAVVEGDEYGRKNARPSNLKDERTQSHRQLHQNALPFYLEDERTQSQVQLYQNAQPSNLEDERKQSQLQFHQNTQPSNLKDEKKQSQHQLHQNAQPSNLKFKITQSQRQWFRSKKARWKAIARTTSFFIHMTLIFILITGLFIILLIRLLKL